MKRTLKKTRMLQFHNISSFFTLPRISVMFFPLALFFIFTNFNSELQKVYAVNSPWQFYAEAWCSYSIMSPNARYTYNLELGLENPNSFPIFFDKIVLTYDRDDPGLIGVVETHISPTGGFMFIEYKYNYGNKREKFSTQGKGSDVIEIPSHKEIIIPNIQTGAVLSTFIGSVPRKIDITLFLDGREVSSEPQISVLPPIQRIPAYYELTDKDKGLYMDFFTKSRLPQRSGIINSNFRTRIFEKAKKISPDATLYAISPKYVNLHKIGNGIIRYTVKEWHYLFSSKKGSFFLIKDNPEKVEWWKEAKPIGLKVPISQDIIKEIKITCDLAVMMATIAGAKSVEDNDIRLISVYRDNKIQPLWILPYRIGSKQVAIFADTGEIALMTSSNDISETFEIFHNSIWNK